MSHDPVTYLYESWEVVKVHLSIECDSSVLEVQCSQIMLNLSLEAVGTRWEIVDGESRTGFYFDT